MPRVITTLQAMSHPTVVATINVLSEMSQRLQDENDELKAAVAAEREACEKVCDDHWNKSIDCGDKAGALQCVGIRTTIRARGQA
jgi:hypothetical protein